MEEDDVFYQDTDSDEGYSDDEEVTLAREKDEPEYKVINKATLLAAQSADLRKVSEVLGIRLQHARALLIHHRWDVEGLFGKMADKGEEVLYLEAGVPLQGRGVSRKRIPEIVSCGACLEEVPRDNATMMDCDHCFCNDCWRTHFVMKITEGQSRRVTCMEYKCNAICDEDKVRGLISKVEGDVAERFETSLLESYIEDNARVKWCPSAPHCGSAIRVEGEPWCELECTCSMQFCFNCLSEPHSPCSCSMWELWQQKCRDESETVNWLVAHTKPCPKCKKPVEKNGGCNLVACVCGQAFCWLCGSATGRDHTWTSIQGHSCGRYKEEKEKEAEAAERQLKRYIHYHSRFQGHMNSLKFEEDKKNEVADRISKLEESEQMVKDYTWLNNGLQRLFRARRVLAYSFAFAFYMFGDELFKDDISEEEMAIKQNLFEDQQEQLVETVEKLAKLVDSPMDFSTETEGSCNQSTCPDLQEKRMQVVNCTAIVDLRCKRMYEVIENDLLGALQLSSHHIAPYRSHRVERVSALQESPVDLDGAGPSHNGWSETHGSWEEAEEIQNRNTEDPSGNDSAKQEIDDNGEQEQKLAQASSSPDVAFPLPQGGEEPPPQMRMQREKALKRPAAEPDHGRKRSRVSGGGSNGGGAFAVKAQGTVGVETRRGRQKRLVDAAEELSPPAQEPEESSATCPVCFLQFDATISNDDLNRHVDQCLGSFD
eukprot:TRINITY_DN1290_c0_g1_i1.p1 TRINITY_DN1290_c0_g1~~TRINITY_DN1290_c0_g1_i1.p1  ORF type:complete len:712 (-),score=157.04 TRINITY_DN1290_c0_g1_i1:783-2918(-)